VGVLKLGLSSASVAKELVISPSSESKPIGRGEQQVRKTTKTSKKDFCA